MSRRDEAGAGQHSGGKERRQGSGHRVMFEALVAVGGQGAGFEAESVDVSRDGMRLRTAYLPMPGDVLVCRFDGGTGEVAVRGEVVWCNEEARGGEFGLSFVDLDEATAKALRALCEEEVEESAAPEAPKAASQKGHRVRLHIEGLGSPMKARIRDAEDGAVHVGSALEFLKVGRTLELEDVDQGARREAWVDDVKVEVDPASSVPQLVVSLRFDAIGTATATKRGLGSMRPDSSDAMGATVKAAPTPEKLADEKRAAKSKLGAYDDIADAKEGSPATKRAGASAKMADADASDGDDAAEASDSMDDEEIAGLRRNRLHDVGDKLKSASSAAMGKLAPAMSGLGDRAKSLWGKVGANIEKRREMKEEQKPRRVTAPPPSGALKASGRKVVREEEELEISEPISRPGNTKRKAAIGAVIGLLAVFAIWGGAKAMSGDADKGDVVTAAQLREKEGARPKLPAIPGAPAVAEVPLFGATPMSTTEQVVMPPAAISGQPAAGPAPGGSAEDEGDEVAEGGKEPEAKADGPAQRKWGTGDVKNPKVLRIKMDGPLVGITGRDADGGFTITVPGRKSAASVSGLARKDKRIEAVDVVNKEDGAVVTVKFKNGDVPGFLAQAKGDRLEIAISSDGKGGEDKSGGDKADGPAKKVASKSKSKDKGKDKAKPKAKPKK